LFRTEEQERERERAGVACSIVPLSESSLLHPILQSSRSCVSLIARVVRREEGRKGSEKTRSGSNNS